MKYFVYGINCLLLALIPVAFMSTPINKNKSTIHTFVTDKQLQSVVLKNVKEDVKEVSSVEKKNPSVETVSKKEAPSSTEVEPSVQEKVIEEKTDILESQTGKMSGYGPDCSGCSGFLASGKNAMNGNIYYSDPTYGQVRIVAGDYQYKFGTIVRVKNSRAGSFLAVVLDRGGSIGFGKKFLFDLLYSSEKEASYDEVSYNVTFEVLRYGY